MTSTAGPCARRERDARHRRRRPRPRGAQHARPHRRSPRPRRASPPDEGLWIERSPSIHMFFMRFAIDAVFVGADGRVTKVVPDLEALARRVVGASRARLSRAGGGGGRPQRHAARRRAAHGRRSLDLPRDRESVDVAHPGRPQDRCARLERRRRRDDVVHHDHRPAAGSVTARTAKAARRLARRAARSSRCCFVVGRTRSRRSTAGRSTAAAERPRDQLGLVVAALPQALAMDRDRNQRHGTRHLQEDPQASESRPSKAARPAGWRPRT